MYIIQKTKNLTVEIQKRHKTTDSTVSLQNRNVFIDNVKGILIFLVVFGHVIEKYIYKSNWYIPYGYIYIFHMPLFIYFSGYFSKNAEKAQSKSFTRFLLPYIVFNSLFYLRASILKKEFVFSFLHDGWMLWYFLSLFTMCIMLPFVVKIRYSIILAFLFSLIAGFFSEFSWFLSLSRTVCFGGYFLLGYYTPKNIFEEIKKRKEIIFVCTLIISVLLYFMFTSEFGIKHVRGIILTLYRNEAYKHMEIGRINGFLFRAITIPLGILFSSFILAVTPNKKTVFSEIGKASIIIFIFHGYFVGLSDKLFLTDENSFIGILYLLLFSIGLTLFLSLPIFYKTYNKSIKGIENIIFRQ